MLWAGPTWPVYFVKPCRLCRGRLSTASWPGPCCPRVLGSAAHGPMIFFYILYIWNINLNCSLPNFFTIKSMTVLYLWWNHTLMVKEYMTSHLNISLCSNLSDVVYGALHLVQGAPKRYKSPTSVKNKNFQTLYIPKPQESKQNLKHKWNGLDLDSAWARACAWQRAVQCRATGLAHRAQAVLVLGRSS